MKRQIERVENYPDVLKKLEFHLKETETQAERLKALLEKVGSEPSAVKDMGGHMMGSMAALSHSMAGDEILKDTFANYAFENFEIASYKSLIALAEASKNTDHVKLLETSLGEEVAMAGWIEKNIEKVTLRFVELSAKGETAKV